MDIRGTCRYPCHDDILHTSHYETNMYDNRHVSMSTPTKRKHYTIDDEDGRDGYPDSGYFSYSPSGSHSHKCERNFRHDDMCDSRPECRDERRRWRQRFGDEDVCHTPRRHGEWTAFKYRESPESLQSMHETTPTKNRICPPRRCFTDTKNMGDVYHGQFPQHCRSYTCVKSRKRLNFHESVSDCYQDPSPCRSNSRRNLQCDLDSVDSDWTRKSNSFTHNINNDGERRHPCATPMPSNVFQYDSYSSRSPAKQINSDISSPRNTTNSIKPQCSCSDLQNGLLKLAASAFSNIRRKASSPESFVQFKTELDLTNEFLQQTLLVMKQIKEVCGH